MFSGRPLSAGRLVRLFALLCAFWAVTAAVREAACDDCTVPAEAFSPDRTELPCDCACPCGCVTQVRWAAALLTVRPRSAHAVQPEFRPGSHTPESPVLDLNPRPPRA